MRRRIPVTTVGLLTGSLILLLAGVWMAGPPTSLPQAAPSPSHTSTPSPGVGDQPSPVITQEEAVHIVRQLVKAVHTSPDGAAIGQRIARLNRPDGLDYESELTTLVYRSGLFLREDYYRQALQVIIKVAGEVMAAGYDGHPPYLESVRTMVHNNGEVVAVQLGVLFPPDQPLPRAGLLTITIGLHEGRWQIYPFTLYDGEQRLNQASQLDQIPAWSAL